MKKYIFLMILMCLGMQAGVQGSHRESIQFDGQLDRETWYDDAAQKERREDAAKLEALAAKQQASLVTEQQLVQSGQNQSALVVKRTRDEQVSHFFWELHKYITGEKVLSLKSQGSEYIPYVPQTETGTEIARRVRVIVNNIDLLQERERENLVDRDSRKARYYHERSQVYNALRGLLLNEADFWVKLAERTDSGTSQEGARIIVKIHRRVRFYEFMTSNEAIFEHAIWGFVSLVESWKKYRDSFKERPAEIVPREGQCFIVVRPDALALFTAAIASFGPSTVNPEGPFPLDYYRRPKHSFDWYSYDAAGALTVPDSLIFGFLSDQLKGSSDADYRPEDIIKIRAYLSDLKRIDGVCSREIVGFSAELARYFNRALVRIMLDYVFIPGFDYEFHRDTMLQVERFIGNDSIKSAFGDLVPLIEASQKPQKAQGSTTTLADLRDEANALAHDVGYVAGNTFRVINDVANQCPIQ